MGVVVAFRQPAAVADLPPVAGAHTRYCPACLRRFSARAGEELCSGCDGIYAIRGAGSSEVSRRTVAALLRCRDELDNAAPGPETTSAIAQMLLTVDALQREVSR